MEELKRRVQKWWDSSPCCSNAAQSAPGSKEFFNEVDRYKDTFEPFTNQLANYSSWKGKRVLEIGCGLGKDLSRFASAGAQATGIDISYRSLELTKKRLEIFGIKGSLCLADSENLPFKDNAFDLIFSWGVLHHTPNTQKAVDEIYRCLSPGTGSVVVMLYNKRSLFYLLTQFIGLIGINIFEKLYNIFSWGQDRKTWKRGREWGDLKRNEIFPALTDGLGNPLSRAFSKGEAERMFSRFRNIDICSYQSFGGRFAKLLNYSKPLERRFGWFMVVTADK